MGNYFVELFNMSKGVRRFIVSESLLGISIGLYFLVFNLHLLDLGFTEDDIGRVTSLGSLVTGIFSIPIGLLGNYFGRKKLLVTGIFLMSIGFFGIGIGVSNLIIYSSQILFSLGLTFLITSEIQLLFHYSSSKKEETKAFSLLFATFTLFTGVGTLLGGFLPDLLGGATTKYQSSILVAAAIVLLTAIIRGLILPSEEKTLNKVKIDNISLKGLKQQLANRTIWILALYTFVIGASYAIFVPYLNIITKFRFDWNDELVSLLLTVNGFFLFLGSIFMPYFLDRFGTNKTYKIVFFSTIILTGILFFSIPIEFFTIILLTRGGSFTMLTNLIDSHAMQAVEEDDRNLFAGMRTVTRSLGASLANLLAGVILAAKNYSLPFLLSALILLIGYGYYYIFVRPIYEKTINYNES